MHRDPVTPEMREAVIERDRGCVAPDLDPCAGPCGGRFTIDHVKSQPMMGKRAPSDMAHLVTLCEYHHLWSGWATAHRPLLRRYLATA
jgi:hypothetical protein